MGFFGKKKKAERTVLSLRAHQNHPEEFVRNTIIPHLSCSGLIQLLSFLRRGIEWSPSSASFEDHVRLESSQAPTAPRQLGCSQIAG